MLGEFLFVVAFICAFGIVFALQIDPEIVAFLDEVADDLLGAGLLGSCTFCAFRLQSVRKDF